MVVELLRFVDPSIGSTEPEEAVLKSPDDVRFSSNLREVYGRIEHKISTYPRGYVVSRSQSGKRVALAFHPNLLEGDLVPEGKWNIEDTYIADDYSEAFPLIRWEAIEKCPKERIAEAIYDHWMDMQAAKEDKSYWDDFERGDDEEPRRGGWEIPSSP